MANELDIKAGLDRLPPTERLRDGRGSGFGRQESVPKRKKEKRDSDDPEPQAEDGGAEEGSSGKILDVLV